MGLDKLVSKNILVINSSESNSPPTEVGLGAPNVRHRSNASMTLSHIEKLPRIE